MLSSCGRNSNTLQLSEATLNGQFFMLESLSHFWGEIGKGCASCWQTIPMQQFWLEWIPHPHLGKKD
jgi:hypothetical protein